MTTKKPAKKTASSASPARKTLVLKKDALKDLSVSKTTSALLKAAGRSRSGG